ncbi:protein kinase family protein [Pirellulaceae bacterium]|nr:protein kinase family protein [Pirellulaceae bacterium]
MMELGNWRLGTEIAAGRWANVCVASPIDGLSPQVDYVIKYVDPLSDGSEFARSMLWREHACAELVSHPNLISFLDEDLTANTPFLVSARIQGDSIQQVLEVEKLAGRQASPLRFEDRLMFFRQICEGLQALHQEQIRHGDIAPRNLIVDRQSGQATIIDLGLSEKVQPFIRATQSLAGSLGYIAPECVKGNDPVTVSADIYSLGQTMKEFFCQPGEIGESNDDSSDAVFSGPVTQSVAPIPGLYQLLNAMTRLHPLRRPTIESIFSQVALLEIESIQPFRRWAA